MLKIRLLDATFLQFLHLVRNNQIMKTVFILFSVIFLTSCPSDLDYETTCDVDIPIADLTWLREIKTNLEKSASASKKLITQYTYQGKSVFLVDSCNDCADNLTTLYNCEGTVICKFGGITGLNTCPDFEKKATDKIILWEN